MSKTMKRALFMTLFIICVLALTVVGASAASTEGYADDVAAVTAGKVVRIGGTATDNTGATYYDSLASAVGAAPAGSTIYLVCDETIDAELVVTVKLTITSIANGTDFYTLGRPSGSTHYMFNVKGSGDLTLTNINIVTSGKLLYNQTTTTFADGAKITENGSNGNLLYVYTGTVNITGGEFVIETAGNNPFRPTGTNCELNISGGTFTNKTSQGMIYSFSGTTNITGGTFNTTAESHFFQPGAGAVVNVSGGTFNQAGSRHIFNVNAASDINISGGTFIHTGAGAIVYTTSNSSADVDITGTAVLKHEGSGTAYIFYRSGNGNIDVDGTGVKLIAEGNNYITYGGYDNSGDSVTIVGAYLSTERADGAICYNEGNWLTLTNVQLASDAAAKSMIAYKSKGATDFPVFGGRIGSVEGKGYYYYKGKETVADLQTALAATAGTTYPVKVVDADGFIIYVKTLADASRNFTEGAKIYASGADDSSTALALTVNGFNVTYYTTDTTLTADAVEAGLGMVARVDDSGNLYTIPYAEKLVADGGTIYITTGYTHTAGYITFNSGKHVIIQGETADVTLTHTSGTLFVVEAGSALTLRNITTQSGGNYFAEVSGTLTIESGTYNTTGTRFIASYSGSVLNIVGGTFNSTTTNNFLKVDGGNCTISGGTFNITSVGNDVLRNAATMTITGGDFKYGTDTDGKVNNLIYNTGSAKLYIKGGTFTCCANLIYSDGSSVAYITGTAAFASSGFSINSSSKIYMSDSAAIASGYTARMTNTSATTLALPGEQAETVFFVPSDYHKSLETALPAMTESNNKVWLIASYTLTKSIAGKGNTNTSKITAPVSFTLTSIDPANITLTVGTSWMFDLGNGNTTVPTLENIKINVGSNNLGYLNNVTVIINEGAYITGAGNANGLIKMINGTNITVNGGTFAPTGSNPVFGVGSDSSTGKLTINGGTFQTGYWVNDGAKGSMTVEINGGTFTMGGSTGLRGILLDSGNSTFIMNGGDFTVTNAAANNLLRIDGAATITGGSITINTAGGAMGNNPTRFEKSLSISGTFSLTTNYVAGTLYIAGGSATISGGTFASSASAIIDNDSTTAITISGGSFTHSGTGLILDNVTGATANITGGTFSHSGSGTILSSGTMNISSGSFTHTGTGLIVAATSAKLVSISGGIFVHYGAGDIVKYSDTGAMVKVTGTATLIHEGPAENHIFLRSGGAVMVDGVDVKLIACGNNFIFENGYQNTIAGFNDSDDLIVKGAYLFTERSDKTFIRDDVDASYINFSNVSLDSDAVAKLMRGDEDLGGTKIVYYFKCRLYTAETKQITIPAYGENEAQTITVYTGYASDYAKAIASAPTDGTQTTLVFLDNVTSIARIGGTKIVAGQNIVIQGGSYYINGSNATYFLSVEAGASLTLSDVAFTGCPTQFANVAGTLHLQSGATLTCTANSSTSETDKIINLSGTATLTIDEGAGIYTVYPDDTPIENEPGYGENNVNGRNPKMVNIDANYTGTITIGGEMIHKWNSNDWGPIFRIRGDAKIVVLSTAKIQLDTDTGAATGTSVFMSLDDGKGTVKIYDGAQISATNYPVFAGTVYFDSDESAFNFNPNYTARIGDNLLCTSYYETYVQAIAAVPASGTATIYLLVDVVGAHADLAYSFTVDSQTITLSGVLKEDGKTYTSLTTTGSSTDELFTFNTNGVETYLTFANINITVAGPLLFGDCPGSTLTLDAGAVLRTAETLSGTYLIKCYDWAVITLNAGARIDTTGSTVTGDYQLINFYSGSAITNANAAVNINGEIIFKLTGPEATSQLRVFSMTDGFAGTITIGETANITYAPINAKASTSGVFVAYANIEINGGSITMGVYDEAGPDTATIGYLFYFGSQAKTVNINDGTVINYTNNYMYNGGTTLNIKGGSMTAYGSGRMLNVTGGTVTISGGTLTQNGTAHVIYNAAAGTVNITGGTLAHSGSGDSAVIIDSYGALNISGGELDYTGSYQMLKLRGTTTISGGTFTNTSAAGSNTMIESSGTTTISGTASFECASSGLMFNVWGGSFTVNGGSFETATASAIISNSHAVTISGGTFTRSGTGAILKSGSGEVTNVSATDNLVVFKHTGSGMIFNNQSKCWIQVDGGASSNVHIIAENTSQVFYDGYCAAVANAYIYVAETAAYVSPDGDDFTHISYQNVMFGNDTVAVKMYAYLRVGNETTTITVDGQQRTVYVGYYGFMYDVDEAIAAAIESGKTLYLIKTPDQSLPRDITVAQGKALTIDGNGFTQSVASGTTRAFVVEGSLTLQNITLNANGLFASVAGGTLVIGDNATLSGTWKDPNDSSWTGYIEITGENAALTVNATAKIVSDTSNPAKEVYVIRANATTGCVITLRGEIEYKHASSSNVNMIYFAGTTTGGELHIYGTIKNNGSAGHAKNASAMVAATTTGAHVYVYGGAVLTHGEGAFTVAPYMINAANVTITGGTFTATGACSIIRVKTTGAINVSDETGTALFKHTGTGTIIDHNANYCAVNIDGENVHILAMGGSAAFYEGWKVTVKDAYLFADENSLYATAAGNDYDNISLINVKFDDAAMAAKFYAYFLVGEPTTITVDGEEKQVYAGYDVLKDVWATVTTSATNTITVVKNYTVTDADAKTISGACTIVLQGVENGEGGYTKLTETISDLFLNIQKGVNLTTKNIEIVSDGSLARIDANGTKTYFILGENTKLTTAATVRTGDLFDLWNVGYLTVTESAVIDTTGSTVSGRLQMFHAQGNAYNGEIRIEGTITHALTCTGSSKIVRFSSKNGAVTVTATANITYSCVSTEVTPENAIFHNYPGSGVDMYAICYTYNIEGGTITHTSATGSVFYGAGYGPASLNLKGGTVNITGGGNLAHLTYGSEIRVTGGTVNVSGSYLFSGDRSGTAYVSGGTINLTNGAVMMKSPEAVIITGGTFTADASSKGATSAENTVGVSIKGIAITDDAMASRLLANFRANDLYYTSLKDAMAALGGTENTIYVVGNGLRKVDRTAGGFTVAAGNTLTLAGVDGLGVMNVNGMNDTYLFVVNGTLVIENVTLTNCPTKLANVSGTLTMNGVTAELFSKRDDEAAVHETSPFIYLQGAGVASLDADTVVRFTYADDDDTHDAVDYQASIYVFHTASDWTGTLTIAGTVEMGWNVRGYSAIFYLESTQGTITITGDADILHTATEGASDNALLISLVTEGSDDGRNNATWIKVLEGAVIDSGIFAVRMGHVKVMDSISAHVMGYDFETISIVITWAETICFVYTPGAWDAENHVFEEGTWAVDTENADKITLKNEGNVDVTASFAYTQGSGYETINGAFKKDGNAVTSIAMPGEDETVYTVVFSLSGIPSDYIDNETIGTVTITISE